MSVDSCQLSVNVSAEQTDIRPPLTRGLRKAVGERLPLRLKSKISATSPDKGRRGCGADTTIVHCPLSIVNCALSIVLLGSGQCALRNPGNFREWEKNGKILPFDRGMMVASKVGSDGSAAGGGCILGTPQSLLCGEEEMPRYWWYFLLAGNITLYLVLRRSE